MTHPDVRIDVDRTVGTIALARPAKRNAVTYDMWVALGDACARLAADAQVRVVVLRGEGDHFCAGADITELLADRAPGAPSFMDVNMLAEQALATLPKPTVAAIRGDCIGGGAALAIDCDLRVAAEGSRFGITPAKLGIVYPPASLERVTWLLGPRAKRLLYTGELVDAAEALRMGLVDEVVPADQLDARVEALCATLTERSLLTQASTKEMVAAVLQGSTVPEELAAKWAREAVASGEMAEGVAAFAQRRAPRFPYPQS